MPQHPNPVVSVVHPPISHLHQHVHPGDRGANAAENWTIALKCVALPNSTNSPLTHSAQQPFTLWTAAAGRLDDAWWIWTASAVGYHCLHIFAQ